MKIKLENEVKKAIRKHFNGLVGLDKIPRTKSFLQLDCLEKDIWEVIDRFSKEIDKRLIKLEKR